MEWINVGKAKLLFRCHYLLPVRDYFVVGGNQVKVMKQLMA
jgi:hypothetical protein